MATDFTREPGAAPHRRRTWRPREGEMEAFEEGVWHEEYAYEQAPRPLVQLDDRQLTQTLGWFSIGLGLTQLLAPGALGRAIGVGDHPAVLRMLGVREIVSGLGLLSERAPGIWAVSRVAGDAMDLALLGVAARREDAQPQRIAGAASFVLGAAMLDVYASQRLMRTDMEPPEVRATEVVAINATPQQLYDFWTNVENLPRFMPHVKSVSKTSERTSHWVVKGLAGATVEWDSEIVDDQPGARIGWRTLPDSEVRHEGMVSFEPAPGGRGSFVRVELMYWPPAGKVGARVARLFGQEPRLQINADLRRFKQLIEAGEVATTLGQPSGRRSILGRAALGGKLQ